MVAYGEFESINIGFPSVIPPVVAMVLALITKEVVSSLFMGVLSAAIIYSIAVAMNMVEGVTDANVFDVLFTVMSIKIGENVYICLFILFIGSLINLVSASGGAKAYAIWAKKTIRGRRKSMFYTAFVGLLLFLDDYFNTMTTGTIMHTVTEVNHVSRAKTAYIVHTMSTNLCITIPLTSWAAAIVSQIGDSGVDDSFLVFLQAIPFNIYSLLCFFFIIFSISFDFDYGKMKFYEINAKLGLSETNEVIDVNQASKAEINDEQESTEPTGTVWDLLLPLLAMVGLSIFFMFQIGYTKCKENCNLIEIFRLTSSSKALLFACFASLFVTLILYVPRKLMTFTQWLDHVIEGMKNMISTLIILVLAWSVSGVSGELLQTGPYIGQVVQNSPIPPQMIPAVVFIVGMVLSFATGTAWGTFSLLIPIAVNICSGPNQKYLIPSIASCLCGAVFGNNTSPISDTTILVSSAVNCPFLMHVSTQLPYAGTVAAVSIIGFLIAGYSGGNLVLTLVASFALLVVVLCVIYFVQRSKKIPEKKLDIEMNDMKKENSDIDEKGGDNDVDIVVTPVPSS